MRRHLNASDSAPSQMGTSCSGWKQREGKGAIIFQVSMRKLPERSFDTEQRKILTELDSKYAVTGFLRLPNKATEGLKFNLSVT